MAALKRKADGIAEGARTAPRHDLVKCSDPSQLVGFGKHMWLTFKELAEQQRDYCYWILEHQTPSDQMRRLQGYLRAHTDFSPQAIAASAGLSAGLDPSLPVWVQRCLQHARDDMVTVDKLSALRGLRVEMLGLLHSYQTEGVVFGIRRRGRVLLGDEMGLGKTVQALAIASYFRGDWPMLIVVPAPLRNVWRAEIHKWLSDAKVQVVQSGRETLDASCNIHVISYDLAAREQEHLLTNPHGGDFGVVICDESHYLRNDSSLRTQALVPVMQRARRVILISGTPLVNGAFDAYPQLHALLPATIPAPGAFAERYCHINDTPYKDGKRNYGVSYQGVKRGHELTKILACVMIQRLKADVAAELPPKRWRIVPVSAPRIHGSADTQSWRGEPEEAQTSNERGYAHALANVGKAKIKSAAEYVGLVLEGLAPAEKIIVFAHHHVVLDGLASALGSQQGAHSSLVRVDGCTPRAVRDRDLCRFQEEPAVRIALLSITACSLGITLTAASHVIFAELYAVPAVMRQAEDRAHRVGQTRCVDIHYLMATGTIDDRVMDTLIRKRDELAAISFCLHQEAEPSPPESPLGKRLELEDSVSELKRELIEEFNVSDSEAETDHTLAQLVSMGFEECAVSVALQTAGGKLESALEVLMAATVAEDRSGSSSTSSHNNRSQESVSKLVNMGFDATSANRALQETGGQVEGALERLLSQAGS